MDRHIRLGMAGILMLVLLFAGTATAAEVWVHFIVVPVKGMAGAPADVEMAMAEFKVNIAEMAGGYTDLGPTEGGFLPAGGELSRSKNFSFIVSAPEDLTRKVEELVGRLFAGGKPFVLVWPGKCNY